MSGGLLSLKWNNHQSTFLHVLSSLCLNDTLSDVTLACEGEFFAAHKLVLATCSEYFDKIFEKIEGKHSVIVLKDVKAEELEALLNYMYEGEVNVLQEKLPGLINAAEYLKIKGLSDSDDAPKLFTKQSLKNQQRDRISPCDEASVSPPAKRKRQDSESGENSSRKNTSPGPNSNVRKELVQESNIEEPQLSRETDESSSRHEDEMLELDRIKDEPSELEFKNESSSFVFPNESSQFLNTQGDYYPQISDGSLPSISSLPDSDKDASNGVQRVVKESTTTSSNVWESSGLSNLLNSNRIGLRRISSEAEKTVRPNSGEHLTITPDEFASIPHEGEEGSASGTFACPFCPFKTFQKNVFDTHLRRHSSEKTFFCQFCSYSCMTKSNLKCHIRKHTGEKPFGCPFCNYRSAQSSNIKIHVRRMHKSSNPPHQEPGNNPAPM